MSTRKNLGMPDRIIRIAMGIMSLSIISLAFIDPKTPLAYLGLLGIMPLIAGISGFCLPYEILGINTYRSKKTVSQ